MKDKPLSFAMPQNACNSHLHIIDPTFPNDGKAEIQIGTVETYRKLADELGLPRAIFVQAVGQQLPARRHRKVRQRKLSRDCCGE